MRSICICRKAWSCFHFFNKIIFKLIGKPDSIDIITDWYSIPAAGKRAIFSPSWIGYFPRRPKWRVKIKSSADGIPEAAPIKFAVIVPTITQYNYFYITLIIFAMASCVLLNIFGSTIPIWFIKRLTETLRIWKQSAAEIFKRLFCSDRKWY